MTRRLFRFAALLPAAALLAATGCTSAGSVSGPEPSYSPNPKHSELVQRAALDECPDSSPTAQPGGLPAVTLPCLGAGPQVHLAGLTGTPTVVNVWGSWCRPCQKEARFLARVYDDLARRVRFLGVDSEDDPDSALDFAAHVSPPMRYPSVVDDDKVVLNALGVAGPPITLFVDTHGRVVHREFGEYTSADALRADIAHYLGVRA